MKLREIERLRAVAALLVMIMHVWPLHTVVPSVLQSGWSGVDLFFVISGFVVSLSLLRLMPTVPSTASFFDSYEATRGSLQTFYIRRFFRIMPPALVVAVLVRVFVGVFPKEFGTAGNWLKEFVCFFGGIYNYNFFGGSHLNVYWTLAVEEHFYLLLPIVFVITKTPKARLRACACIGVLSIVLREIAILPDGAAEGVGPFYLSHNRFDSLMAGVVLALVSSQVKTPLPPRMPRWSMRGVVLPAALALLACLPAMAPRFAMARIGLIALWMLGGLLVRFAALDQGYILDIPVLRQVLEIIGARSYALYLMHEQIFRLESGLRLRLPAYAAFAPDTPRPWKRIVVLLIAIAVAVEILHQGVEKPMMRVGKRLLARESPPVLSLLWKRILGALALLAAVFYFRHDLLLALGPSNLARQASVLLSSHQDGSLSPEDLVNGRLESEDAVQTRNELHPWATLDFGRHIAIGAIRVYNREDGTPEDNYPLKIEASDDNENWTFVARRESIFTQEWPWRIRCYETAGRFLRFQLDKKAPLGLTEVEVFPSPWMAMIP